MLRASSNSVGLHVDLRAIVDEDHTAGPDGAAEILAFTRPLVRRTEDLPEARAALRVKLGDAGAAAVAGSVGNFEMMNRILDATGVPTPGTFDDIERQLRG